VTWITVEQAASRLGVKRETIYAYISRGLIGSRTGPDGRRSDIESADVEHLAARGRRGQVRTRSRILDVPIETRITRLIPEGRLAFRGHDITTLVDAGFERVAELLWTGDLPDRVRWPAVDGVALAPGREWIDALRVAVVHLASTDPLRTDLTDIASTGRRMLAGVAASLSPEGKSASMATAVTDALGLTGRWRRIVDAAMSLMADHELATSTLAVRVAASTRADPYACVLAGLAALDGPLHGRASRNAAAMVRAATQAGADRAVSDALALHGRLPGFGHSVYRGPDPRSTLLLARLRSLGGGTTMWREVDRLEQVGGATSQRHPNVDFALGVLAVRADLADGDAELIFATARIAGWLAHMIEEVAERPLRYRARALYVS
jgi:citrate synthase